MTEKKRRFSLRGSISLLLGAYALGLLVFAALRLIFGDTLWWLAFLGNFTPFYFIPLLVLLPLALILRARRSVLLMLPVLVIGLLIFGREYLPKAQAAAGDDAKSLRLISFNVWGDNHNPTLIEDWLKTQDADVVVTVEMPPAWANGIPSLKQTYPYQIQRIAPTIYKSSTILSRRPIISSEEFNLSADGADSQQRVVVDVDGQQVAIYGIHLYVPFGDQAQVALPHAVPHALSSNKLLFYDDTERDAQIHALIARLKTEPLPYIVAGDFNTSDQSLIYNDLAAVMGDSFREVGTGLGTSWPAFHAYGFPRLLPPLVRIDYIWHSSQFRALEAAQGPYLSSDHLPLLARLALN